MQTLQQNKQLKKFDNHETLKTSNILIDTCIWIAYFRGDFLKAKEIIDSNNSIIFTSTISLFEFKRFMLNHNTPNIIIQDMINSIEELSTIIFINSKIALEAATYSTKYHLALADSLIYTCAKQQDAIFVTTDKHFLTTPNTILL
jgi:predicted nucleic acid-binding protein